MAQCRFCKREMLTATGCVQVSIPIDGHLYEPIRVGDPGDRYYGSSDGRCGDCGAQVGGYHHPGCDLEVCPKCGGQLISCGCMDGEF